MFLIPDGFFVILLELRGGITLKFDFLELFSNFFMGDGR